MLRLLTLYFGIIASYLEKLLGWWPHWARGTGWPGCCSRDRCRAMPRTPSPAGHLMSDFFASLTTVTLWWTWWALCLFVTTIPTHVTVSVCVCWEKTLLGLLWLFVCWNNTNWGIGINIISTLQSHIDQTSPYIFWNIDISCLGETRVGLYWVHLLQVVLVFLSPLCSFGTLIVDTKTSLSISLMDGGVGGGALWKAIKTRSTM